MRDSYVSIKLKVPLCKFYQTQRAQNFIIFYHQRWCCTSKFGKYFWFSI